MFSVVVPTYNRVATIARALDSIYAQSWVQSGNEIEVIVVDDGSEDDTKQVLQARFPDVVLLEQSNQGVSAARNAGIAHATGDWIALLDSDDEWLAPKLQRQFAELQRSELLVCHTEEVWIRDGVRVNQMNKHQKTGGWIFEHCLPLCAMSPSSIVIHRSVFDKVGLFDPALPACEDYDLWLRISAQYEVAFVAEACINKYGGHADQLSRQYWGMDRFRVLALEKILRSELSDQQRQAATNMLINKLQILLSGAHKRDNQKLALACEKKLQRLGVQGD